MGRSARSNTRRSTADSGSFGGSGAGGDGSDDLGEIGGDSGGDGDGDDGDDDDSGPLEGNERVALVVLRSAKQFGGLVAWCRSVDWRDARNKREVQHLCLIADMFVREGVKAAKSQAFELLCRRIAGVHLADASGNWKVCDSTCATGPNDTLLPRTALKKILREAAQFEALAPHAQHHSGAGGGRGGRRGGRGGGSGDFGGRGRGRGGFGGGGRSSDSSSSSGSGAPASSAGSAARQ